MSNHPIRRLAELGQSIWYDFIERDLVKSGRLAELIRDDALRGMTSNPTIFQKAVTGSDLYDAEIRDAEGDGETIFEAIAVTDVRDACDVFRSVWDETEGADGYVSLEVSPKLARDGDGTLAAARRLWKEVDRPNLMIKIPATREGLPAITDALADGINVNVTLLFSVERYGEVIEAHLAGLEKRLAAGEPVTGVASVASFFVSRVDSLLDPELEAHDDPRAQALLGKLAVANARLAYRLFEERYSGPRWQKLADAGAAVQRPLWASTSTKNPAYPDLLYVDTLVAPHTVNTVPPDTWDAYLDHGDPQVRIHEQLDAARGMIDLLPELGIDFDDATRKLEEEGVRKFADSYDAVVEAVKEKRSALVG